MRSSLAKALSDAVEHHVHGRLSQAEAGYRSVLQDAPDQPDALHRLGLIAHQVGREDAALELIDRAIAVNPAQPTYHNDAGIVLQALGRSDEAIARYRKALALTHAYPRAHNGLGIALHHLGRVDEAIASFRTALSQKPDYADAQNNLANVLREQGRPADAVQIYRKALETRDLPEVWCNLGNTLRDLRAFDEAAHAYASALVRRETPDAIAGFVQSIVAAESRAAVDEDVRRMALRAIEVPWARPSELSAACIRLLASGAPMRDCIDRAWNAWPARGTLADLLGGGDPGVLFDDVLLQAVLESAPVCDLPIERLLTLARFALLDAVVESRHRRASSVPLAFCCALARQCFINEYVFTHTGAELARACALRDGIAASLARGSAVEPIRLAIVAAYFPLSSMPECESMLARAWPSSLDALITQQVREPAAERPIREQVRRLTGIDDAVSIGVRRQYEEHPYPRWVRLPAPALAVPAGADPGARFPRELREAGGRDLDILVAGCGTGQESIELAHAFPRARMLAVDLSLASLAYAERKAREGNVANIEHAQGDLTKLAALGRKFDIVSSVGVLHHLADPMAGWRDLVSMLAPGAHMLVGLYSERSREDVVAARAFIAAGGYEPTEADIRRCREDLLSSQPPALTARLTRRSDFYVTGECRDLLFHVQEHRFTLPRIAEAIEELGLRFNGFLLDEDLARRYARDYPDDPGMENLANWDRLEAQMPQAFTGMYIFWVQKVR